MFLDVRSVSRSKGSSAVARAAYVSRSKLRDERRGISVDFRGRGGLEHSEILLPGSVPREGTDWARERATLWNRAEAAEVRRDARVAREYVVALPHELSAAKRLELGRGFAQHVADRYGVAVDFAVHSAPPGGDPRNHHVHILSTTRTVSAAGLGAKAEPELRDGTRRARGLPGAANEIRNLRRQWAGFANEKLAEAGLDVRIDARSAWERGSAQLPRPQLTRAMMYMERNGGHSEAAERMRELHAAQQQLMNEYARSNAAVAAVPAVKLEPTVEREPSIAERQQRAVDRWREYVRAREAGLEPATRRGPEAARDHGAEFEL
jgi:ATP-dependent exoDNAse (exonuclease V) alpha subunit